MVQPRSARQRPVVSSSDSDLDDDAHSPPPSKRPRRGTLLSAPKRVKSEAKSELQPSSSRASRSRMQTRRAASSESSKFKAPETSPAKPATAKVSAKPITSFFRNAPRLPSSSAQSQPPPVSTAASIEFDEDDFDDDIIDADDEPAPVKPPPAILPLRKRKSPAVDTKKASKGPQKFLLASSRTQSIPPPSQPARSDTEDRRPWTDRFGPVSLDELAVHKKKVADVQQWLNDVFNGTSRKRLLLLKGPAGSGKTTTMSLLSKELDIIMHEWKNPTNSMSTSDNFVSATAQFDDFVGRTGAFGSLAFDRPSQPQSQSTPSTSNDRKKQLVLVEEFPNTFARASSAVQSFRSSVLNYLAANTLSASAFYAGQASPAHSVTPIVMIISETLLSTSTAAADSFTAHRLLGPEILTHPGVSVIEFNPIAMTFMTKALDLIVVKEARKSGRKKTVGPQVIQRLAELGDIRSAASSLEFLCLRGDDADGWGANVNFTKKKGPKDTPITKMEQESLEMVTQRESTLGIFHAVGRVVYNKRLSENPDTPVPQPPNWFPERRRPKASEVNLDTLIDELGTDTQTFTAALHENYALSCSGADSEETMESVDGCISALSDADLLAPDRFSGTRFQGTSTDTLRQDELCFQTSVRGMLFNLPYPIKRSAPPPGIMGVKAQGTGAPPGAHKGSAYSMYYPASLRLWRTQEETSTALETWIQRAQRGALLSPHITPTPTAHQPGSVDSWRHTTTQSTCESTPTLLGSGASARAEMLTERLPYLAFILRGKRGRAPTPATAAAVRELQKITAFHGTRTDGGDGEEDLEVAGGAAEGEAWATDRPAEEPRWGTRVGVRAKAKEGEGQDVLGDGEGLVLSEDDIED